MSLNEALGKGKMIKLGDRTIPVVPATLEDLEDAMLLWEKWINETNGRLPLTFLAEKKEAKEAFLNLLHLATGKKIPIAELKKIVRADMHEEVHTLLDTFLGLNWLLKEIEGNGEAELGGDMGKADKETTSQ
jgi:hypothetical protein